MFFLKKLLQYIEQNGFRAGTGGADKRSVVIAAPTKPAGRAVRRENGEQGFAGNRRGRVAGESVCAAGGDRRAGMSQLSAPLPAVLEGAPSHEKAGGRSGGSAVRLCPAAA